MTIFRFSALLIVGLISGCGTSQQPEQPEPPPALTPEQQATRAQECMAEIDHWRSKGVWIHGGAEPAVNRDAWSALSDEDKQQIADISACISTAGKFEPREIQIVSEGFKVPIEKVQSKNMMFVKQFRAAKSQ